MSKIRRNILREVCADYEQERIKLTKENKNLKYIIQEIFWMARRYAHGRHTYAPSIVRECYKTIKEKYPDIKIKKDDTLHLKNRPYSLEQDYLNDCND